MYAVHVQCICTCRLKCIDVVTILGRLAFTHIMLPSPSPFPPPAVCRPPSLKDLESLEPAFHSSLVWILENDPEPLDLTFTVEEEAFGTLSTHELKEGGMDIAVTEDNKEVSGG